MGVLLTMDIELHGKQFELFDDKNEICFNKEKMISYSERASSKTS